MLNYQRWCVRIYNRGVTFLQRAAHPDKYIVHSSFLMEPFTISYVSWSAAISIDLLASSRSMTALFSGIVNQIIVRRHARGNSPYIPRAKAHFSFNLCSRCVDCSLIICMHTQTDLQTVAGQIHIDRGLPSLERVDTDHETNVSPTVRGVPCRHAHLQSSG